MKSLAIWRGNLTRIILPTAIILAMACSRAFASGTPSGESKLDLGKILLALVIILLAAKLGGDLLVRLGQPAVLGELIFGIIIGNLCLTGYNGLDFIKNNASVRESIEILSQIGVVLLLFQVGLESDLAKMLKVGASSLLVATLGVIAPFLLGTLVSALFMPQESIYLHIFAGATLCATSVGITARVLMDLKRIQTPEARIILGAAVIDDVQGLVILAAVVGIIKAANNGSTMAAGDIALIVVKATVFLVGAILIGRWISPKVFRITSKLKSDNLLLITALALCFTFAFVATTIDLAPIVGAFAAGLILDEVHWRRFTERGEHSVEELVKPLAAFLVPIFFVKMGSQVDLSTFFHPSVLAFAGALTLAAILGKQVCGLGVLQKGLDKLSIGIGMIPRGEVGLIFAAMGSTLVLKGEQVVGQSTFSAVVIMVVVTTMITPPILKWSMGRKTRQKTPTTEPKQPKSIADGSSEASGE